MSKRQMNQLRLPGFNRKTFVHAHGGALAVGKRKTKRPFDPKQALHVVLRSSQAKGVHSLLHPRNCNHIQRWMERSKERWGIRVYRYANVGNHLHLLIQAPSRVAWQGFIREFSGGVAMIVTGARKGEPVLGGRSPKDSGMALGACRGFWDGLVFTRIVAFGRDFVGVARYVAQNLWEGAGVPVRRLLLRGYRVLELSEDGFVLIQTPS